LPIVLVATGAAGRDGGGADGWAGGWAAKAGRRDSACRGRCGCFAEHPARPPAL